MSQENITDCTPDELKSNKVAVWMGLLGLLCIIAGIIISVSALIPMYATIVKIVIYTVGGTLLLIGFIYYFKSCYMKPFTRGN